MIDKDVKSNGIHKWGHHVTFRNWFNELINKIYDDFENRTCKNCKYSIDVDGDNTYECTISRKLFGYDNLIVLGDFGCNKFNLEG
jgi:hypothetical protein